MIACWQILPWRRSFSLNAYCEACFYTQAVRLLFNIVINLQKIRGLSHIVSWSKTSALATERQEIMVNFKNRLDTSKSQEPIHELGIENTIAEIALEAQVLYNINDGALSEDEIFKRYTAMIEKINSTILMVADR